VTAGIITGRVDRVALLSLYLCHCLSHPTSSHFVVASYQDKIRFSLSHDTNWSLGHDQRGRTRSYKKKPSLKILVTHF